MSEFFEGVSPIRYEGPESDNPFAFRWYDADRVVAGRTMAEHLRFGVCYWHTFAWDGFDIFGAGTLDRPWHPNQNSVARPDGRGEAEDGGRVRVLREARRPVLLVPRRRHRARRRHVRRDAAATSTRWSSSPPGHMERTGTKVLWGTTNAFSHRRFMAGAATNPDPAGFRYAAAQVAHCLNATKRLDGANYVLWGGREGYETLLNTDMRRELDQLGRFMNLVVEHKYAIGFEGTLLIEPKPMEPTKHQYDYDVATVYALPAEVRPRERDQGQHRGQPRDAVGPRLPP